MALKVRGVFGGVSELPLSISKMAFQLPFKFLRRSAASDRSRVVSSASGGGDANLLVLGQSKLLRYQSLYLGPIQSASAQMLGEIHPVLQNLRPARTIVGPTASGNP